jgi:hypothetical protein
LALVCSSQSLFGVSDLTSGSLHLMLLNIPIAASDNLPHPPDQHVRVTHLTRSLTFFGML